MRKRLLSILLIIIMTFSLALPAIKCEASDDELDMSNMFYLCNLRYAHNLSSVEKKSFTIPVDSDVYIVCGDSYGSWLEYTCEDLNIEDTLYFGSKIRVKVLATSVPAGTYTITLNSDNRTNTYPGSMDIYFTPTDVIPLESFEIYTDNLKNLAIGADSYIKVNKYPYYATTDEPTFKSSNGKVIDVDENGYFTADNLGTSNITVTIGDQSQTFKASVTKKTINQWCGKTMDLSKYVKNISGYSTGKWSTKSSKVTVDKKGNVKFKKNGKATVTFTKSGKTYKFTLYSCDKDYYCRQAIAYAKRHMYYPESFQLIKKSFDTSSGKTYVSVYIRFSGTNAFGGRASNSLEIKFKNGEIYDTHLW